MANAPAIRAVILCRTFLCAAGLPAQENTDVIIMKNGDRFTCEIKVTLTRKRYQAGVEFSTFEVVRKACSWAFEALQ